MALSFTYTPPEFNFSLDPVLWVVKSGKMSGSAGNYTPDESNLFCYVEVRQVTDGDTGTDIILAKKNIPYSRLTGEAEIDIGKIMDLHPTLPDPTEASGYGSDSIVRVRIAVADTYGVPSAYEVRYFSEMVYVIYGSSRTIISSLPPAGGFDLHAYIDEAGNAISKNITKSQPDWLYYIVYDESNSVDVKVKLLYDDGTDETYTAMTDSSSGTCIRYVATGYMALDIDDHRDEEKNLVGYVVQLFAIPLTAFATVTYMIDPDTEWERYLIVDNGVGGIESVKCSGKNATDISAERQTANLKWDKNNYARGSKVNFNAKGREEWVLRTGWTSNEAYIYHLRQLLVGNLWVIDPVLGFIRVLMKDNSMKEVKKADEVLFALEFKIEFGFEEESMTNFYKKWISI